MTPATAAPPGERTWSLGSRVARRWLVREEPARYCTGERSRGILVNATRGIVPARNGFTRLSDRRTSVRIKKPRGTPEKTLQDAWRRSAARDISLKASDGRWYRVVYAGRWGGSYGPDFVDAVLVRDDGTRVTGDVEVHVRRDGWRAHGHDKDPRYNGVTFHAYLEDAGGTGAVSSDNRAVRELRLGPLLGSRPRMKPGSKRGAAPDVPVAAPLPLPLDLGTAGEERFAARVSGAELAMRHEGVDQALYAAVLECMGFPRNKRQFRELARRLPWSVLASRPATGDAPGIADLLLWAGGFAAKPAGAGTLNGKSPAWTRPAGRPDNSPDRRIRGAARLAERWREQDGPGRAMADVLLGASKPSEVVRAFEARGEDNKRSLIGRGRAAEIVVNAVLPGMSAAARLAGDRKLEAAAMDLYRRFPALPENSITREAKLMFAPESRDRAARYGAREQQGLIYLYRSLTTSIDMTRQLPLGAARLRNHR